jgi:hypothetical protein
LQLSGRSDSNGQKRWRGTNIEWDMKFDADRRSLEPFQGVLPKRLPG